MKQIFKLLISVILLFPVTACSDKENDTPVPPSQDLAENLVGKWLLSTSDAENWICFEFTESARVNTEIGHRGYNGTGTGFYFLADDRITGSYTTDRNEAFYLEWEVTESKPFEIGMRMYDENKFVGDAEIWRILAEIDTEAGGTSTPDFKKICGTGNVSDFRSVNPAVAAVDATSGEITGVKEGMTFVTFATPNGTGVISVTVNDRIKTFPEMIVGTWIYDVPAETEWQKLTLADNGYFLVQWMTYDGVYDLDESAQGTYEIDGQTVSYRVRVAAGQMNMHLKTVNIKPLEWTYDAYDGKNHNGRYTAKRMLETVTLSPLQTMVPDYQGLVGNGVIADYGSHNTTVARVDADGLITAMSAGRTYVDVNTDKGSGVIEVIVENGALPVSFEESLGQEPARVQNQ